MSSAPAARPNPPRLLETRWPDGRKLYVANGGVNFMLRLFMKENPYPYFEHGVNCGLLQNDGSKDWKDLYNRARVKPVFSKI